jgi:hypothetical protein
MHAVLHVVAPLQKVDSGVFLLGLRLALGLTLAIPGLFFLAAASADMANALTSKPAAMTVTMDFMGHPPLDEN